MILDVKNVHKSYGKNKVLNGASFSISQPQTLALVGPNGSGKTTLLNAITNLISIDQGDIRVMDKSNEDINIFYETSYLMDNTVLYPYLSGRDHLNYVSDIQDLQSSRVDEVIDLLNISSYMDKLVRTYSLGMKQHLLIALSILNKPKLLIMDEPLTGLDPDSVLKVRYLLQDLNEKGVTILISSHTLSEIDFITDNILFLSDGIILQEDVSFYKRTEYIFSFKDDDERDKFSKFILKSEWKEYLEEKDEKIIIPIDKGESKDLLQFVYGNSLSFESLETDKRGAEKRYRELFNV